jgi:hypothetical protein
VVDPGPWLGPPPEPVHVGTLAILRPRVDGAGVRRFPGYEILVMEGAEAVLGGIEQLDGVSSVEIDAEDPCLARVVVSESDGLVGWLREHQDHLVSAIKLVSDGPDFGGEARMESIGRFQAALELCQEMMNRHEGSKLSDEFRNKETLLVTEVAGLLKEARCFSVVPGKLERMVELLARNHDGAPE